jgi:hypothetical protein
LSACSQSMLPLEKAKAHISLPKLQKRQEAQIPFAYEGLSLARAP